MPIAYQRPSLLQNKVTANFVISHEAVAMVLFLTETVYCPMFTSRIEFIVETLRILISIHL